MSSLCLKNMCFSIFLISANYILVPCCSPVAARDGIVCHTSGQYNKNYVSVRVRLPATRCGRQIMNLVLPTARIINSAKQLLPLLFTYSGRLVVLMVTDVRSLEPNGNVFY